MDPLDGLFADFLRERIYLHNVRDKTRIWYQTAWKAFQASQTDVGESQTALPP